MSPAQFMFLFFAAVILSGAWIVVTAQNLIHAALGTGSHRSDHRQDV